MIKILTDSLHRIAYATDASAFREIPFGVAYPQNEEDVISLITSINAALSSTKEFKSLLTNEQYINQIEGRDDRQRLSIIPRAGGTSIAGQVVGAGVIVDVSKYLNKILEINPIEKWARVEPGVVLDELNIALKPYSLFFSPETSTSNRCCIGGMFGNNSCGTHSLVYGGTRDHILEAKVVLSDGTIEFVKNYSIATLEERFGEKFWEKSSTSLIEKIYSVLINAALDKDISKLIADNFPHKNLRRRSCGYAIDEVIEDLQNENKPLKNREINLCKLLAGSEGTLAFVIEIKVALDPLPPKEAMALCAHCDTLEKSFYANLVALKYAHLAGASVTAIELIDSTILELSKQNPEQLKNRFFVKGSPAAILIIEIKGNTTEQIEDLSIRIENELKNTTEKDCGGENLVYECSRVYGAEISKIWSLRKAGLGLLNGMKGDAKPIGVIEDTAVAPQLLPAYMKDFRQMLSSLGLECVYYSHISTGELHLRPILNIKDPKDRERFREVAYRTALLVKKYRGTLSGEHGDGRLRGEFIPLVYGKECYELMRTIKKTFDPNYIFNAGKIIDTPPMDCSLRYEANQQYAIKKEIEANNFYYNWKGEFDDCKTAGSSGVKDQLHAFMCSIEQCNGAADCRKSNLIGGTLCPAYKVSKDETKTTRARANILRELLTYGYPNSVNEKNKKSSVLTDSDICKILETCLSCKGCKGECPSNVDMTKLKGEMLQHIYDKKGTPLQIRMIANLPKIQKLGALFPSLYNKFVSWNATSSLIKKILKFAPERTLPKLQSHTLKAMIKRDIAKTQIMEREEKRVYFFIDEFTNYQDAKIGYMFYQLLKHFGYQVIVPPHVESGRAALSKGCIKIGKKRAIKNFSLLKDLITKESPLVGIEPSTILSFRDEYPQLVDEKDRNDAKELGNNALLYDEFLLREIEAKKIDLSIEATSAKQKTKEQLEVWLHGHCHQKALVGVEKTAKILEILLDAKVHRIKSGCCGMAGSFGYEKKHYKTSMEIGEMVLFPVVRDAVKTLNGNKIIGQVCVVAPGTSCREQIFDGTGVRALHPIELLYKKICS